MSGKLCRHIAWVYKDKMFIHGGTNSDGLSQSLMFYYDFLTTKWSLLNAPKK